jgi:hypothetical protein
MDKNEPPRNICTFLGGATTPKGNVYFLERFLCTTKETKHFPGVNWRMKTTAGENSL